MTLRIVACLAVVLVAVPPAGVAAHDIPVDVAVQAFLKPEGERLRLLVRVPLEAMRDADIPTRGPGYIDFGRVDAALRDVAILWIADAIEIHEGDTQLTNPRVADVRVSLLGDQSFQSYEAALARVTGRRLTNDTNLFWNQGMLDVLLEYPILSDRSPFSIHPKLARLGVRVTTVLRFLPPGGAVRAFEYPGDPGLVRLDPRWYQAAGRFVTLGFFHILDGTDHLLFLLCLVIPFRRFRALVPIVTAFTVAHSVTLMASAYGQAPDALWFPPLVETLIAMSIVYMALENIAAGVSVQRRWIITFAFGLVHGFGFSFALRETLQFAGSHLLTSLLSFNVGVELGQLLVLALMIPALELLFRFVVDERMGTIILSALVAHTAWHWMIERGERLRRYPPPSLDLYALVVAMRWLMLIVVVAGLAWLVFGVLRRPGPAAPNEEPVVPSWPGPPAES
jgi:hypothetical protein